MRVIKCDVCGKEISSLDVYARLNYKTSIKTVTKTGRETIRKISRSADFCSLECFKKFNVEAEPIVTQPEQATRQAAAFSCDVCGKPFKGEAALKIHRKLAHKQ
jgi:hypothetical protein